jgi:hypothetical protein
VGSIPSSGANFPKDFAGIDRGWWLGLLAFESPTSGVNKNRVGFINGERMSRVESTCDPNSIER